MYERTFSERNFRPMNVLEANLFYYLENRVMLAAINGDVLPHDKP